MLIAFFSPKKAKSTQKALFGALGTKCSKTLKKHSRGALSRPGPLSTPVIGSQDRKVLVKIHTKKFTRTSPKTREDKFFGVPFFGANKMFHHDFEH